MYKPGDLKIIQTGDGSHSLLVESMNETYHSTHGALTESRYVFIDMGLKTFSTGELHILEIGFGTGLNALLSCEFALGNNCLIHYDTIEAFPLDKEVYSQLNYPDKELLRQLHEASWDREVAINPFFNLKKWRTKWENFTPVSGKYDLVYYDAFAPSRQAEMWAPELLRKMQASMKTGGIMVTYCAQGAFKRNLRSLGMEVETLSGPPGKAEMVRARK